jgi:hypothetical protein
VNGPIVSRLRDMPSVPDAGHASNLDSPAAFDALLLPFLAELTIQDRPVADRSGPRG